MRAREKIQEIQPNLSRVILLRSKVDLAINPKTSELLAQSPFKDLKQVATSTVTEDGLNELKKVLAEALGIIPTEGTFIARRRHLSELEKAYEHIKAAQDIIKIGDLVLCAQEMKEAQDHLGTITGKITSDDILGIIFSTFCIGK